MTSRPVGARASCSCSKMWPTPSPRPTSTEPVAVTTLTVLPRANARRPLLVAAAALVGAMVVGLSVGPAGIPLSAVFEDFAGHIPFIGYHPHVSQIDWDVLWQVRAPRVVLGGLVGAMLA